MKVAVVIPCYKVSNKINGVLKSLPSFIDAIYLIDDCCPDRSTERLQTSKVLNINIIKNIINLGVGGAVKVGYRQAMNDGYDIIVKIDGDGQMKGEDIIKLISPILDKRADYVKGNRFLRYKNIKAMPLIRLVGNAGLSFITKFSTGYWNIADPTNGFTAIHRSVLGELPLDKISDRYFFESDMLFRIGMISGVVIDVPVESIYEDENSSLEINKILHEFIYKNIKNFIKRLVYSYYIKEVNIGSFELPIGLFLLIFGLTYGVLNWIESKSLDIMTPTGIIMMCVTSVIVGVQMLLSFINYDIASTPKSIISR
jgi:glycosyltransferase involved in cell wall biosynthesis